MVNYLFYLCGVKDRSKSGIYKIVNTKNGKFYIGSAKSLYYRKATHFCNLKNKKHHNKALQNAYNKYGKNMLEFIVVEYCEVLELIQREQFFIDTLKPVYNFCKTAGSPIGIKRTEDTKNKIRLNHAKHNLGKKFSDSIRLNMSIGQRKRKPPKESTKIKTSLSLQKEVVKYDFEMNVLEEYKSLKDASLENSIPYKYLSALINGTKKSNKIKLIFKYKSDGI